jgi:DNA-directed RNA polymerase subunit RPC12/RpoP
MASEALKELYLKWYPVGQNTCVVCQRKNEAGEKFHYHVGAGDHCLTCHRYKEKQEEIARRAEIRSGERDTNSENEITCPYCGYEFSESYDYLKDTDTELGEIECRDCGKPFICTVEFSVSYSTERKEGVLVEDEDEDEDEDDEEDEDEIVE